MPENNETKKVLPRIRKYLFGNGLDLGCGSFPVVEGAIAVDRRPSAKSIQGDIQDLSMFSDKALDYVFSSHALEDLKDTRAVLTEWCRVLKPGGYLVLYLPHEDWYPKVGHPLANRDHVHNFNTWSVASILQAPSFLYDMEIVESSVHGWGEGSYEDLFAGRLPGKSIYDQEYSFQIVARRRGKEPDWAPSRLHVPQEHVDKAEWGDGFRLAVVDPLDERSLQEGTAAIGKALEEHGVPVDCVVLSGVSLQDMGEVSSKALAASADLVVDFSQGRSGELWAAGADVDCIVSNDSHWHLRWKGLGPRSTNARASREWELAAERAAEIVTQRRDGISLTMIVKDEMENLPHCFESLGDLCDEKVIVDTGSSDKTPEFARSQGALVYYFPWRDDFAAARNYGLARTRKRWTLWMDADDVLKEPWVDLRNFLDKPGADTYAMFVEYGGSKFQHQRLLLTDCIRKPGGIRFDGMVHEYPVIDGLRNGHSNFTVVHGLKPAPPTKQRESRNVRICERQCEAHPDNPRHWFYFGNALREAGDNARAVEAYERYLSIGVWADEMSIAARHMGHAHLALGDKKKARESFLKSISIDGRWAESYFDMGSLCYEAGQVQEAARWFESAAQCELHDSPLFKQATYYSDAPLRALIKCALRLKDLESAERHARRLVALVGDNEESAHVLNIVAGSTGVVTCPICHERPKASINALGKDWATCDTCTMVLPYSDEPRILDEAVSKEAALASYGWADASRYMAGFVEQKAKELLGTEDKLVVLDVMSAVPVLADELAKRGHEVHALDAAAAAANTPEAENLAGMWSASWERFERPDWEGKFDVIVLMHAMQHFLDPVDGMKKVSRYLKPGGLVFSRHLDHDAQGVEHRAEKGKAFWLLTNRSTEALADEANLEVVGRDVKNQGGEADVWFRKPVGGSYRVITGPLTKPVVFVRPGAIGDVLLSTYAVRKFKQRFPETPLHFSCAVGMESLLEGNPYLDEFVSPLVLNERMAQGYYEHVRLMQYPTLTPTRTDCLPHRRHDYPEMEIFKHLADIFAECAGLGESDFRSDPDVGPDRGPLDIFLTDEEQSRAVEVLAEHGVTKDKPFVTIQTATGWSRYKEWYQDRWRELAGHVIGAGCKVVHLGGPGDNPLWRPGEQEGYVSLLGKTPLRISVGVLREARVHVGLDSVLLHACNTMQKLVPSVVLWGSTSAKGSGWPHSLDIVEPPEQGCQPCYRETNPGSVHPKGPCPHDHACMKGISVLRVWKALELYLSRAGVDTESAVSAT